MLSTSNGELKYDKSMLPTLVDAWQDDTRVGKPVIITFGQLGVTDLPEKATCIAYLDAQGHTALKSPDARHVFDCVDLDRLFAFSTYREWSRHDNDPRRGILLMGPSGTGKTTFFEERYAQRGIPVYSETANPDMMAADLIQTKEVVNGTTYWEDGPLLKAMREGVPFVIQEIDLFHPSQLTALNEIIEKGKALLPEDKSIIIAKRGFQVHATCNSSFTEDRSGNFRGTRGQNQAVANRFYKYVYPFATPEEEAICIRRVHPQITEALAARMAQFAEFTRKASDPLNKAGVEGKRLSLPMSRRHLLDWADMFKGMSDTCNKNGIPVAPYTLNFVYSANLGPEEQAAVEHLLKLAFTNEQPDAAAGA